MHRLLLGGNPIIGQPDVGTQSVHFGPGNDPLLVQRLVALQLFRRQIALSSELTQLVSNLSHRLSRLGDSRLLLNYQRLSLLHLLGGRLDFGRQRTA